MVKDVGHMSYKGRLRELALFSVVQVRKQRKEDLIAACKYFKDV